MLGELWPQAGLQLLLHMNGNWNDSTTNGYNFTASGSPTFISGKFGNGGNFVAASSQYIYRTAATLGNVLISTSQTWSFWIKLASFPSNNYLMGRSTGGAWFMNSGSDQSLSWSANGLSVGHSVTVPSAGIWHHVVFSYNSSTNKISSYINGSAIQNQVSVTGTLSTGAGTNFAIGRIGDYAGYGTFAMDEVAMWNRELTAQEIQNYYAWAKGLRTGVL